MARSLGQPNLFGEETGIEEKMIKLFFESISKVMLTDGITLWWLEAKMCV